MGWAKGFGYMAYMTQQLGLSRSTLLSLLVMVSTVAIFATGATFAITVSDSASGIVKAGAINPAVDVYGTGAAQELLFAPGALSCPTALLPGDACAAPVTVKNIGNVPVTLGTPVASVAVTDLTAPPGCVPADWLATIGTPNGAAPATLNPNVSWGFSVIVTLQPTDPVACQQEQATVSVSVSGDY